MEEPITVLYVDDYSLDRELVRDALEKQHGGFRVFEAASRREFERLLAAREFDIVLSDFNISGFDGMEVIDSVRKKDPNLPVVIVTGTGSEEVAVEAMRRGAADYVIKTPKHIQKLPHTIYSALERKRMRLERHKAKEALRQSEEMFSKAFRCHPDLMVIATLEEGRYLDVNQAFLEITGYARSEVISHTSPDIGLWVDPDFIVKMLERLRREGSVRNEETRYRTKSGEIRDLLWSAEVIELESRRCFIAVSRDITEFRKATEKLQVQKAELEEANIALRVLLKQGGKAREEIEERVLSNIRQLVMPNIEELEQRLVDGQRAYLSIVKSSLNDITSSFSVKLSSQYKDLSPKEIQVADLIRQGRSNKEMAELLNLSVSTIEFHRQSIRQKLGLKHKKTSLASYLLQLR